jgi:HAD superfamily hydrolase (TIGR01450 family)
MLWVFDLDGVVWLAGDPIPGSAEAIERLRSERHRVAFVTNNSTPTVAEYVKLLGAAGVEVDAREVVTSSQAAASLLSRGDRVAFVGGAGVGEAIEESGAQVVPASENPDVLVVGRSLRLDFEELASAARAIRNGARFVATNSDATFPTLHGVEPGAGALVAYLEVGSGRQAEVAGKPQEPMADLVRKRFGTPDIVVGDRAETDGLFAERVGAAFGLVLTGVTTRGDLPVKPAPALVGEDLSALVASRLES